MHLSCQCQQANKPANDFLYGRLKPLDGNGKRHHIDVIVDNMNLGAVNEWAIRYS